jgi:mannose-6-phosphate isomerase-like protein (cupin superfamily)
MRTVLRVLAFVLLVAPAFAQGTPAASKSAFALWRSDELAKRNQALSTKIGPDHSARETLADYGDHRFRFIRRDADGFPEQHDQIVDVVYVQSGEGTLQLGGKVIGLKAGGGAGEFVGTSLEGGERHAIAAGDVLHIPAAIPHAFLVGKGKHITYVLLKFPAK